MNKKGEEKKIKGEFWSTFGCFGVVFGVSVAIIAFLALIFLILSGLNFFG